MVLYIYIIYIYNDIMLLNFVKLSTLLIEKGSHKRFAMPHCSSSSLSTLVLQNLHLI